MSCLLIFLIYLPFFDIICSHPSHRSTTPKTTMSSDSLLTTATTPLSYLLLGTVLSPPLQTSFLSRLTKQPNQNREVPTTGRTADGQNVDDVDGNNKEIKGEGGGVCFGFQTYNITSGSDLSDNLDQLECIFARGTAPLKPPIGIWFGDVLSIFKTVEYNSIIRHIWAGKMGVRSQCRDSSSEFHLVFNVFGNNFDMPGYMFVGQLEDPLHTDEHSDGKPSLFVDYTINMRSLCPIMDDTKFNINLSVVDDPFPINQLVDLARVVGRTKDGGHILLGRTLARNPFTFPAKGDRTVAWWYVVNFDTDAYPPGMTSVLGPLSSSFSYRYVSGPEFFSESFLSPAVLSNPLRAYRILIDYIWRKPLGMPPVSREAQLTQLAFPTAGKLSTTDSNTATTKNAEGREVLPAVDFPFQWSGRVGG
eukprot:GHVS01068964.1.p1 GENE.GHVS01068964.1~~GHVS01068964.1.p1  ORF type:complete len:419 (-),score=65.45 GHVS01068964.1:450-1706(-)